MMRILLVEDDAKLRRMLARGLGEEGYAIAEAATGEEGLAMLLADALDGCILDVMLPGLDGYAVLQQTRAAAIATPILLLTARDAIGDRVRGLDLGADDYLVKPFAFAELVARLRALLRRGASRREPVLRLGELVLDPLAHEVSLRGQPLALSEKQFALLQYLLVHRGEVVSRSMVLREVFGYAFDPGTNLVDVHIANLRQRLGTAGAAIETVRGVGYRARAEAAE